MLLELKSTMGDIEKSINEYYRTKIKILKELKRKLESMKTLIKYNKEHELKL